MNRPIPEDDDLGQATVRELIVKLALTEDEQRSTTKPGRLAALARREQAIVAALHQNQLALKDPGNPKSPEPSTVACSTEGRVVK